MGTGFRGALVWLFFPFLASLLTISSLKITYLALFAEEHWLKWFCRFLVSIYGFWMYLDRNSPFNGSTRHDPNMIRIMKPLMDAAINYFDRSLTLDFNASKSPEGLVGIFCCHPHGICSIATLANFGLTGGTVVVTKPIVVLTLVIQFYIPIWRDIILRLGFSSVNRGAIENLIKEKRDFAIVPGGAREALDACPGKIELTLRSRKGIFRLALKHGAALYPVINFGEDQLFDQIRNTYLRSIQIWLMQFTTFSMPLFYGKYGPCPAPVALQTVIGKPIVAQKCEHPPTSTEISELQERYIKALIDLHAKYKHIGKDTVLILK